MSLDLKGLDSNQFLSESMMFDKDPNNGMVSKNVVTVTSYSQDWPKEERANSRLRLKLFTDVCLLTVAIWYFLVLFPKQDLPLLVLSIWWATSQGYLKLPRR